jgi:Chaperone of endosialidase
MFGLPSLSSVLHDVPIAGNLVGGAYDKVTGQNNYNSNSDYTGLDAETKAAQDARQQYLAAQQAPANAAPTAYRAQIGGQVQDQSRQLQLGAANSYQNVLNGTAPSVAQLQQQASAAQTAAQQGAMAASARGGGNRALALRTAMNNTAQLQAGGGADAALLRANEQNTARAGLANVGDQMRGQDQNMAINQANLDQGANLANVNAAVTTNGQNQTYQTNLGQLQNAANAQAMGGDATKIQSIANDKKQGQANDGSLFDTTGKFVSGLASDENAKTDIAPASGNQISQLFSSFGGSTPKQTQPGALMGSLIAPSANDPAPAKGGGMDAGGLAGIAKQVMGGAGGAAGAAGAADAGGAAGALEAAGPALALASDVRVKADVTASPEEARRLFAGLHPKTFNYKPEMGLGNQKHLGVIAQDVEKSGPLGRGMVDSGPGGVKQIDVPQATGALMAAMADFEHRLNQLQGKKGRASA